MISLLLSLFGTSHYAPAVMIFGGAAYGGVFGAAFGLGADVDVAEDAKNLLITRLARAAVSASTVPTEGSRTAGRGPSSLGGGTPWRCTDDGPGSDHAE